METEGLGLVTESTKDIGSYRTEDVEERWV